MRKIDAKYRKIDDIKSSLKVLEEVFELEEGDKKRAFEFFNYPKGKELQLTVRVEDPDLVNIILTNSMGSGEGLMAGMSITDIRFGDLERKDVIIDWLKDKLNELENTY